MNATKRKVSITMDPAIVKAGKIAAKAEDRDFSGLCSVAVREYAESRGYMAPEANTATPDRAAIEAIMARKNGCKELLSAYRAQGLKTPRRLPVRR